MKKNYMTPEVSMFDVVAERGYEGSVSGTLLPGYGTGSGTWDEEEN